MRRALPSITVAAVLGCIFASGCGGATTAFTRTGPTLPAQPGNCEFAVLSAAPGAATELGTIDIKYMKQTDWIYDEKAFKRKVGPQVCQTGGDTVVPRINDNGLYLSASVYTTKSAPAAPDASPAAPPEPEAVDPVPEPATSPSPTAPAATPDKSAQAAAKPDAKAGAAKDDDAAKAVPGKKGSKKGASAKKDDNIRGKDGKIDIDKLL